MVLLKYTMDKIPCDIIGRLIEGDSKALEWIYDNFSQKLYARLIRILKDETLCEEIIQDIFLAVWKHRETIDLNKNFNGFLFKISDNLAISALRKIGRDQRLKQAVWANMVTSLYLSDQSLLTRELSGIVNTAIQQLPPQRRKILELCKLDEKSYAEVAQQLGISVATVSNHMTLALKDLRRKLAFYLDDKQLKSLFIIWLFMSGIK